MAEQGAGPSAENPSEALPVRGEIRVPDCVDAAMEAMQMRRFRGPRNFAPGIAQRPEQLFDRDNAVLPLRKVRKGPVRRPAVSIGAP